MPDNDDRTYIKVHDGMPDHPKVDGLSDKAFRLLVETWCWCSRHLTDGHVPDTTWQKRGTQRARRELVDAGLVFRVATGGVQCHDYLSHQRSAGEVAELREKKKLAGAKGNHDRWHVGPKGKPSARCPWCPSDGDVPVEEPPPDVGEHDELPSQGDPDAIAGAIANASQTASDEVSDETRETSPETEELLRNSQTETDPPPSEGGDGGSADGAAAAQESKTASSKDSAEGHRLPEGWQPTDADRRWLFEKAPALYPHGGEVTEEFRDHWLSKPGKDARKTDWSRAWKNWMRKARGYPGNPPRYNDSGERENASLRAVDRGTSTTDRRVEDNAARVTEIVSRRKKQQEAQQAQQQQLPGTSA